MCVRVSFYLITLFFLGCAGDLDDQSTKQDLNEDETVESNDSVRVTPQVKDEVDEPIPAKASQVAKEKSESLQATNPEVLPKSETLTAPEIRPHSNEAKNSLLEDDELVAEPAPVVEKLLESEVSPSASPEPAEKEIELSYPSPPSESYSRESGKRARLHRGMPALNLWYLE
jgi:hypothetical protein